MLPDVKGMERQADRGVGGKVFNKKKWRETRYGHKQKVEEWELKRKEAVKRKYHKMVNKDDGVGAQFQLGNLDEEGRLVKHPEKSTQGTPQYSGRLTEFQRAKLEYERVKELKEQEKQERAEKRKEREEAIKKSKQQRIERIKKLTQKTKKGQPVMKGRIEILLEKIQKQMTSET